MRVLTVTTAKIDTIPTYYSTCTSSTTSFLTAATSYKFMTGLGGNR